MLNLPATHLDRLLTRAALKVDTLWTPPLTDAEKAANKAEHDAKAAQAAANWAAGVRVGSIT